MVSEGGDGGSGSRIPGDHIQRKGKLFSIKFIFSFFSLSNLNRYLLIRIRALYSWEFYFVHGADKNGRQGWSFRRGVSKLGRAAWRKNGTGCVRKRGKSVGLRKPIEEIVEVGRDSGRDLASRQW